MGDFEYLRIISFRRLPFHIFVSLLTIIIMLF